MVLLLIVLLYENMFNAPEAFDTFMKSTIIRNYESRYWNNLLKESVKSLGVQEEGKVRYGK